MKKHILSLARAIISRLPRGKSRAIRMALFLGGRTFDGLIRVKDGRRFYIDTISLVKRHLFFANEYEDYETNLIRKIVKPGDYVFDVGASYGWYTTLMSRLVGDTGKVFAFELDPYITAECRTNIHLNHQEHNTIIEALALGDTEGVVDFVYSKNLGLANLNADGGLSGDVGIITKGQGIMTSLDHYVQQHAIPKIDFIKCDIDGAEVMFLNGARQAIASKKPVVIIEASGAHGRSSCYEIFNELEQCGYAFFSLHHKTRLKPIRAHEFRGFFKENILCLPAHKMGILETL